MTLTFPACAMHKVVAAQGEPVGSANLCELFHEYFAGLMSAFSGKSYAAATVEHGRPVHHQVPDPQLTHNP